MENEEKKTTKVDETVIETTVKKGDSVKEEKKSINMDDKTKKIILFSAIGVASVVLLIGIIIFIVGLFGKPSKSVATDLVKDYLEAINDKDSEKFEKLIDVKGYVIYKEEGLKKFDSKFKEKDKYINKYMNDKGYEDIDEVKSSVSKSFKTKYQYDSKEYSFKEIVKIEKSTKSKKTVVIKAKIKAKRKNSDSSDTKTMKMYVTKVDGKFKVVGVEIE